MSDILEHFTSVRALTGTDDLARVLTAADADQHMAIFPTHVAEKAGEIVGYASIGFVSLVNVWAHSQRLHARESLALLNLVENVARAGGHRQLCVPCAENSPFRPYMAGLGYQVLGNASFNLKGL